MRSFVAIALSIWIVSLCSANESIDRVELLPTLQVALFVHPYNKLNVLPFTLTALQNQDYPSSRIRVHVYCELYESIVSQVWSPRSSRIRRNEQTLQALKLWSDQMRSHYAEVTLHVQHEPTNGDENEEYNRSADPLGDQGQVYWDEKRYERLIRLRSTAFHHAVQSWADFVLFLDADVVLTNRSALHQLIDRHRHDQVFAPMLDSFDTYSNFWAGMTTDGYYERTDRYLPILHRDTPDSHIVPMVHSCFLINMHCKPCRSLYFSPKQVPNAPIDDMIVFGLSARSAGIEMRIDNRFVYGFVLPPIDREDAGESDEQLLQLHLQHLYRTGQTLPVASILESFVRRSSPSPLFNVDRTFVINLKRRPDRQRRMQAALNLLGIEAEMWTAVDGRQLTADALTRQNITFLPNYRDPFHQRPMTYGEIGCFLSHYHIWQHVLHNQLDRVLILEDDVRFEANFKSQLHRLLESIRDVPYDLLYLGRKPQTPTQIELAVNSWAVRPAYSYWTIGYVLSQAGARKLIEGRPLSRLLPVDEYLPILFDRHPNNEWNAHFSPRNLLALSAKPLLIQPLFYIGDQSYVSDTEQSNSIDSLASHSEL
jgi:collagen beta-1,O-galactosyltransferase